MTHQAPQMKSFDYPSSYNVIDAINDSALCINFSRFLTRESSWSTDANEKAMYQLIAKFLEKKSVDKINHALAIASLYASQPSDKNFSLQEVTEDARTDNGEASIS